MTRRKVHMQMIWSNGSPPEGCRHLPPDYMGDAAALVGSVLRLAKAHFFFLEVGYLLLVFFGKQISRYSTHTKKGITTFCF